MLVNNLDSLSPLPYRPALQIPTSEHQVRGNLRLYVLFSQDLLGVEHAAILLDILPFCLVPVDEGSYGVCGEPRDLDLTHWLSVGSQNSSGQVGIA